MTPASRSLAILLLIGSALLAVGCSAVRLGYGQAERALTWYVEGYVDLDQRQGRLLGQQLAGFKQWHCRTQLGRYADWLREVGREFQPGLDTARVEARLGTLLDFARILAEEAAPRLAPLGRSLDAQQILELQQGFEKANREYREEWMAPGEAGIRAKRAKRLQASIAYWVGSLDARQAALVAAWSRELRMTGEETLASRLRWQQALLRVLEGRGDEGNLDEALRALLAEPARSWTPQLVERVAWNRALTVRLLAEIANTLDEAQREHLLKRTSALGDQLDGLACPPTQAAAGLRQQG